MKLPEDNLRAEIIADAEKKSARLLKRAQKDADELFESTRKLNEQQKQAQLNEARNEAAAKVQAIDASTAYEIRQQWLIRQEQVIAEILQTTLALAEAAPTPQLQLSLKQLLCEAVAAFPDDTALRLQLRPEHVPLLEPMLTTIPHCSATLSIEPDSQMASGLIVSSIDNRRRYDNTYRARLQRLRQKLRIGIAEQIGAFTEIDAFLATE